MHISRRQERIGELCILISVVLFSFFPIIGHEATRRMPPLLFAGIAMFFAGIFLVPYLMARKTLRAIFVRGKARWYIAGVTLLNMVAAAILIFIGISKTSSVNTAILMQTEVLFTLLVSGLLFGEAITRPKILGALFILTGATIVVWNGHLSLNAGDLFLIAGTVVYPFGNWCAKQALRTVPPEVILFLRNIFGGAIMYAVSFLFETHTQSVAGYIADNFFLLFLTSFGIYALTKVFWYEGYKRLDLSKTIAMGHSFPALSLLFSALLLGDIPTRYQLGGLVIIFAGLFAITRHVTSRTVEVEVA